jgi:hypothetical protein
MRYPLGPRLRLCFLLIAILLPLYVPVSWAQDAGASAASPLSPDTQALAEIVRQLQSQIQILTSEVSALRTSQDDTLREVKALRIELREQSPRTPQEFAATPPSTPAAKPVENATFAEARVQTQSPASAVPVDFDVSSFDARVTKLEEAQDLLNDKVTEQSQTKVESGSKYRVRFSGIVLLNTSITRGSVDNLDFPQIATPPENPASSGSFAGSLRQSQVGVEAFGPDLAGARTSANVRFDFSGGFPNLPNGTAFGIIRLRTGTIRLDWRDTSIIVGQDGLFFAPLTPTSLAALAIPALSYSGNLWSWTPQIRVEHRITLNDSAKLTFQAGILDQLTGDYLRGDYRYPTVGEQSGQPAYASRIALATKVFGRDMTFGAAGYYGRQNWGPGSTIDGWAGLTDVSIPLGTYFDLSGEFYRGRAVGGLGGGIGQSVLVSGTFAAPGSVVRGLDSLGGWAQLKFKPRNNFELNFAYGQDDPFTSQLRAFPASQAYYGSLLTRNQTPFVNFIYRARSDILFSAQYQRLKTLTLDATPNVANQVTLSMGYLF